MVAALNDFFDVTQIPASGIPVRKRFQHFFFQWKFRSVCQANEQKMYFALCVLLFGDDKTHKCTKYDAMNIEKRLAIDAPIQQAKNSFGQHLVARHNLNSRAREWDRGRQHGKYSTHIIQVDTKR